MIEGRTSDRKATTVRDSMVTHSKQGNVDQMFEEKTTQLRCLPGVLIALLMVPGCYEAGTPSTTKRHRHQHLPPTFVQLLVVYACCLTVVVKLSTGRGDKGNFPLSPTGNEVSLAKSYCLQLI